MPTAAIYSGRELDFLVPLDDRIHDKYQVTATLTAEDEKRELGAFALADPYLRGGRNILLSLDEDEATRVYHGVSIERVNLIRWLLGL